MNKTNISNKEHEILKLMWDTDSPLTAKQICDKDDQFIMSTVQTSLRKLLNRKLIEVDEIVYSGTSLSRSYRPAISMEEFILSQYKSVNLSKFMSAFIDTDNDNQKNEIMKIEALIEEFKNKN